GRRPDAVVVSNDDEITLAAHVGFGVPLSADSIPRGSASVPVRVAGATQVGRHSCVWGLYWICQDQVKTHWDIWEPLFTPSRQAGETSIERGKSGSRPQQPFTGRGRQAYSGEQGPRQRG